MTKIEEMKNLVSRLNTYRDSYYNFNRSMVSDNVYDGLFDRLKSLEDDTGVVLSNSPTVSVGYEVKSSLRKVKHNHPMLSLDKTKNLQDIIDFMGDHEGLMMLKCDGLTCSLRYVNGELVGAETRGNGDIGEDVLHNAKVFTNIPQKIPYLGEYIIDGEAVITYDSFERINESLPEGYKYKNPRNLVSGSVRQLDSKIAAEREIKFIAWKVVKGDDSNSFTQRLCHAKYYGFEIVPYYSLMDGVTEDILVNYYVKFLKKQASSKEIPIDGIVFSYDDIAYSKSLGATSHHVKSQIAYKFGDDIQETILRDIEWNTSRTGQINPVAIFDPVEIDGTAVNRASLSNVSIIKELELGIGDTICVCKSNMIIPKVTDNITRSGIYKIPTLCPACGHFAEIHADNGREVLYCENPNCRAKMHDILVNFCGKHGMDINGLSEERLNILMDEGLVTDFASVYELKRWKGKMISLDRFGANMVNNLLSAIEDSSHCKLENVLVAIGIPGIGRSSAKAMSKHIWDIMQPDDKTPLKTLLHTAGVCYDWSVIPDFGTKTSDNINAYLSENYDSIAKLVDTLDVQKDDSSAENVFAGKTFCITGKLNHYSNRDELVKVVESMGGKVVSGVTKKTDYLINNDSDSNSSKNRKAKELGIPILSEENFLKMMSKSIDKT